MRRRDMNKKVLVICGDLWHPEEVIHRGIDAFPVNLYEFDFTQTPKDILTEQSLRQYAAVMICKGNSVNTANPQPWFEEGVTAVGPRELTAYMQEGGLLLIVHAGSAWRKSYVPQEEKFTRPNEAYIAMIGNEFTGHPPRCPVAVHVTDPHHPVTKGVSDFTQSDEHYQITITNPRSHVFLESSSEEGGTTPAGYELTYGNGRLICLTPGHTLSVWTDRNFQKLILNALDYGCRG